MGERSAYTPGTFCFADVGTGDREAAAGFYSALFGWTADSSMGEYTMFRLGGKPVAGMFAAPEDGSPAWLNYISVEDADSTAAAVRDAGGSVLLGPRAVSEEDSIGRTAVIADRSGAVVALWEPGLHKGAGLVNQVGAMVWNQLATPDLEPAKEFYGRLFGWTYERLEGSDTEYWTIRNSDNWLNGGVMSLPSDEVPSHWSVSFTVEDAGAAAARVEELGGQIVKPPAPSPVGLVGAAQDPTGAAFGFFAGEPQP